MTADAGRTGRARQWLGAGLVLCVGALTATAVLVRLRAEEWPTDGPARLPWPHGYVVRYRVGQVFTDGLERVVLRGTQPGVLRRVELTGPGADHFQLIGLMVAGPHRRLGSWEVSDGFPPDKPGLGALVPGVGALLATGRVGSVLLIGLRVVKPGLGIRGGITVYYTVGGRKFSADYSATIVNCPRRMTSGQCLRLA